MLQRPILVVDDHLSVADRLRSYLMEQGYMVDICEDPSEAYERCAASPQRYGLVFMDVHFPVGDVGLALAQQIKTLVDQGGPNVILMTGHRDKFDKAETQADGVDEVILKPLFKWLVVRLVEQHGRTAA